MVGPELRIDADEEVPLTKVLNTWSGSDGQFARLLISEQGAEGFNLCWHVEALIYLKRLACNTFARANGGWRGAYVIDGVGGEVREYR